MNQNHLVNNQNNLPCHKEYKQHPVDNKGVNRKDQGDHPVDHNKNQEVLQVGNLQNRKDCNKDHNREANKKDHLDKEDHLVDNSNNLVGNSNDQELWELHKGKILKKDHPDKEGNDQRAIITNNPAEMLGKPWHLDKFHKSLSKQLLLYKNQINPCHLKQHNK